MLALLCYTTQPPSALCKAEYSAGCDSLRGSSLHDRGVLCHTHIGAVQDAYWLSAEVHPQDRTSRSSGMGSMASSLDGGRRSSTADGSGLDMLSLTEWPGVPQAAVLLPPGQCRSLWRQFVSDSNFIVQQVGMRQSCSRVPPAG